MLDTSEISVWSSAKTPDRGCPFHSPLKNVLIRVPFQRWVLIAPKEVPQGYLHSIAAMCHVQSDPHLHRKEK